MKKIRGSAILMMIAILGICGFQGYWLKNNYDREKQNLDIKTAAAFRQTILQLQAGKLKLETISLSFDTTRMAGVTISNSKSSTRRISRPASPSEPAISLLNLIQEKLKDSLRRDTGMIMLMRGNNDSLVRRMIKDSSGRIRTVIHSVGIGQRIDSLIPNPEAIRSIRVDKSNPSTAGNVTITYSSETRKKPADSITTFKGKHGEGYFIEKEVRDIPVPPAVLVDDPGEKGPGQKSVFRFLYDVDSLSQKDSVTLEEIDSAFSKRLKEDKITVGFAVSRLDSVQSIPANAVTLGFSKPTHFTYALQDTWTYMLGQLKLPILFSLLLVGITIASFVLLYRNMMQQKRLADLKNEFISNITHELKTPIATVGVAIEALKSFNAIDDPRRTKEYLDISQNELQRLNLLVDKVLKLSMFEKKEIELKYEVLNLADVVDEVVASMRLQTEKYRATVTVNTEGDCTLQADRLHLLSVVFNLLDNALKYGKENPAVQISLEEKENSIELKVADNGIGIPAEYKDKVFDKFFRIPHGDTHDAKGYGLGLSYVAHVVKKHKGTITVESGTGSGATFIINLPKQQR
jgi:two-component system phosphate regulon sensor histidine kinase PhoR